MFYKFAYSKDVVYAFHQIIGPLELLVAIVFALNPKTFVVAMRECVEIVTLVISVFIIQGIYHSYAGILGLGLRASKPFEIGVSFRFNKPHFGEI